jgi:hypothetical protein
MKFPVNYAQAVLVRECDKIAGVSAGMRNSTLYNTACHVFRKCQGVLSREEMETALMQAGRASGLTERETRLTVRSAWDHV